MRPALFREMGSIDSCSSAAVRGSVFSRNMSCTVGDIVIRFRPALFPGEGLHKSKLMHAPVQLFRGLVISKSMSCTVGNVVGLPFLGRWVLRWFTMPFRYLIF